MGSGTAWLPDAARMPAYHASLGRWTLMVHGSVFLQYDRQLGTRADDQLGSVNWVMVMAGRPAAGGTVRFRLSLAFEHAIGSKVAGSLYAAPVGEPALGPVSYLHRPSAAYDPTAPLGHHTQDFTHTSFGVVTVGAFTRALRLEASAFNGAHPDDVRTDFDPVRLDSYAARVTCNPAPQWSVAAWFGHVAAAGGSHAHDALDRFGASVLHTRGAWSTAFVYGGDLPTGAGHPLNTLLLESTLELDEVNAVYGRAEYVRRTAADLALVGSVSREVDIEAVSLGYERGLWRNAGVATSLGARGTLNLIPEELRLFYGSRTPVGLMAYVQVRPTFDRRKG